MIIGVWLFIILLILLLVGVFRFNWYFVGNGSFGGIYFYIVGGSGCYFEGGKWIVVGFGFDFW